VSGPGAPAAVWTEGGAGGPFVPVTDRGFLYGEGLFETFLVRGTRPFRLALHLERMEASARALGMPLPEADWRGRVETAVQSLAASSAGDPSAALWRGRLTLTPGDGPTTSDPSGAWLGPPRLVLTLSAYRPPAGAGDAGRIALPGGPPVEGGEGSLLRHKSLSRLVNHLCLREARARGAEEGLLMTRDGAVLCGSRSNLFVVTARGDLVTSPSAAGCLPGVTRRIIIEEVAPRLGLQPREEALTPGLVAAARAAFLTNSLWGVAPLARLSGQSLIRAPAQAVTTAIYETYGDVLAADQG
jgi:branched-subunit amino acid aminotransferase/4-amino-4-deoxychorismate lyase